MADTNRVGIAVVEETGAYGVTPANPVFQSMRITSAQPSQNVTTAQSKEIRQDRQVADLLLTAISAGGDIDIEQSYGNITMLKEGAMGSRWQKKPSVSATAVGANGAVTVVGAGNGAKFPLGSLVLAQGFKQASNNGIFKVTADGSGTTVTIAGMATQETGSSGTLTLIGFEAAAGDMSAAGAAQTLTITATSGNFTKLGLQVGEWIKIGGAASANQFTQAGCNGWARISGITATTLTLDRVPAGWANSGATGAVRLQFGNLIRNGTSLFSYAIERSFNDIGQYEYFGGMTVKTMSLDMKSRDIATGKISFLGQDGVVQPTRWAGATFLPPLTNPVMNTSSNVGQLMVGGQVVSGPNFVIAADLSIENNNREKPGLGTQFATGIALGEFNVSGNLDTYFGDATIYNQILNNVPSSFMAVLTDPTGAAMLYEVPRLKFKGGTPQVPGANEDVHIQAPWQGIIDPVLGCTMQMMEFPIGV